MFEDLVAEFLKEQLAPSTPSYDYGGGSSSVVKPARSIFREGFLGRLLTGFIPPIYDYGSGSPKPAARPSAQAAPQPMRDILFSGPAAPVYDYGAGSVRSATSPAAPAPPAQVDNHGGK